MIAAYCIIGFSIFCLILGLVEVILHKKNGEKSIEFIFTSVKIILYIALVVWIFNNEVSNNEQIEPLTFFTLTLASFEIAHNIILFVKACIV